MKIFRRVLCMLLAFMVMLSVPVTALAAEFDLYLGDVNVTADESGQTTSQPDTNTSYVGYDVTITTSAPTDNTVTITTNGGDASVTLQDVTIDATGTGEAAVTVDRGEDTTVTIELDGTNTLQSDTHHAGLETRGEGELVIQDQTGEAGSLEANGGNGAAGIGGDYQGHGMDITITGGEITAVGGSMGAGIGGGYAGIGGDITITGGEVTAVGEGYGAGIGGGSFGDGRNITITGGIVTAEGSYRGSGIGGGDFANNITISGNAVVTAVGGEDCQDIGAGYKQGFAKNYDNSGLYTTGSINGVPGTVEPPVEEMPPVETPLSSGPEEEPVMTAKNIAYDRFWRQVEEKIRETPRGESLTIDAGGYASMPSYVMDAIADTGVTLVVQWFGGEDVVVDHAYTGSVTYYRFYFSVLPQLLAD